MRIRSLSATLVFMAVLLMGSAVHAATFFVNSSRDNERIAPNGSPSDESPGDGVCYTGKIVDVNDRRGLGVAPECTLRAAIEEANALAGFDSIRISSKLIVPNDPFGPDYRLAVIQLSGLLPALTD